MRITTLQSIMKSTTLKVPNQLPQTLENKMSDLGINHSVSRSSLGESGSFSCYYTNDNSRSLSRDSSFSSYSTSSTTGSSSCGGGELDSPLRRIIAHGSSRRCEQRRGVEQEDRPCSRLFNSRRNHLGFNREDSFDGQCTSNLYKTASLDATGFPQNDSAAERSRSEPEVSLSKCLLSSPQGLIIATPPTKRASVTERRNRSKSESYNDDNDGVESPQNGSKESKIKKKEKVKRRVTTSFDWCLDDSVMKRVLAFLDGTKDEETTKKDDEDIKRQLEILKKERDLALSERDEALRDCDRLNCERNALELERDNLRQERDDLKKELANRSLVIDHLKEHLGMAHIPFKIDSGLSCDDSPKTSKETPSLTVPKTIRQRSKSEVRPPQFFVPDEIFQRINAYTRF